MPGQRVQKTMGNGGVMRFYDGLMGFSGILLSGKHLHNYGKSPFEVDLPSYKMVIFHSYVKLPEGT